MLVPRKGVTCRLQQPTDTVTTRGTISPLAVPPDAAYDSRNLESSIVHREPPLLQMGNRLRRGDWTPQKTYGAFKFDYAMLNPAL